MTALSAYAATKHLNTTATPSSEDDSDAAKKGKLRQGKPKGVSRLSLAASSHSKQIGESAECTARDVSRVAAQVAADRVSEREIVIRTEIKFNEADSMLSKAAVAFLEFTPSAATTFGAIGGAALCGYAGGKLAGDIAIGKIDAKMNPKYNAATDAYERGEIPDKEYGRRLNKVTKEAKKEYKATVPRTRAGGRLGGGAFGIPVGAHAVKALGDITAILWQ
jgi:hypothetical protein